MQQYGEYQDKKAAEINQKATQIKKSIGLKQKSVKEKENLLNKQKQGLGILKESKVRGFLGLIHIWKLIQKNW